MCYSLSNKSFFCTPQRRLTGHTIIVIFSLISFWYLNNDDNLKLEIHRVVNLRWGQGFIYGWCENLKGTSSFSGREHHYFVLFQKKKIKKKINMKM